MLFRRNRPTESSSTLHPAPVLRRGMEVLSGVLLDAADSLVVSSGSGYAPHPDRPGVSVRYTTDSTHLLGILCGQSLAGLRVAGLSTDSSLLPKSMDPPARNLPLALHFLHSGIGPYPTMRPAEAQGGQLIAVPGTLQESVDFALIAQRLAELGLAPAIVVHDQDRLLRALQRVDSPSPESIQNFLGSAGELIGAATPAQEMLFGNTRRRIPRLMDRSLPVGIGSRPTGAAESLAEQSYLQFVLHHIPELLAQVLAEFHRTFGRPYKTVQMWGKKDAPYALILTGPDAFAARDIAAAWTASGGPAVSILRLPFLSPFPGDVLSGLLQGKRAVAVLESGEPAYGFDLASHVRRALACSLENGRTDRKELPFPDHAVYLTAESVPRIEVMSLPHAEPTAKLDALQGVLAHLTVTNRAVVNVPAAADRLTSPHAERRRQVLARAYPSVIGPVAPAAVPQKAAGWVVCGASGADEEDLPDRLVRSLDGTGGLAARSERFALDGGTLLSVFLGSDPADPVPGGHIPVGLAVSTRALRCPELWNAVQDGGLVIALMQDSVSNFWAGTSPELRRSVADRAIRLMVLEERPVGASSMVISERFVLLAGALVAALPDVDTAARSTWRDRALGELGRDVALRARYTDLFTDGFDQASGVTAQPPPDDIPGSTGPDAPRPLRRRKPAQPPLLDPVQHWNLFLGRSREGLSLSNSPDPALAFSAVPAAGQSSAGPRGLIRDLPHWIPESCSACGRCWSMCPESAIGVFAVSFGEALGQALSRAEGSGADVFPVRRLEKALSAQAQRLIKADDLGQHRAFGSVLDEAYRILSDRIDASDEERGRTEAGLVVVRSLLGDVPFRRVDSLFAEAEKREKGSGRVLSLTVDPDSCTSCGICVTECPDAAIESRPASPDHGAAVGRVLDLLEELRATYLPPADLGLPTPELASFLADSVALSFRAADDTTPGSGSRIAIRMALAGALSSRPGSAGSARNEAEELADRLEGRIRATLVEPFQVNDLEEFASRLDAAGPSHLDAASLASLVTGEGKPGPELAHVRRLIDTLQALRTVVEEEERLQNEFGAGGLLLAIAVDGPLQRLYRFPSNPHPFPWLTLDDGPALGPALSGILDGRMREAVERTRLLRRARLMAEGSYDAVRHEKDLSTLSWTSLSESERAFVPVPILVTDQEEALLPVLQDRLPVTVVLLTSQPVRLLEAGTAGDPSGGRLALRQPAISALLEPGLFVAQTSISRPEHLIRCVGEAVAAEGPALVHVLAPEPSESGLAPDETIAHAEAAVCSRVFPLFARRVGPAHRSALLLDLSGNPEPGHTWVLRSSVDLTPVLYRGTEVPITPADWAVDEGFLEALFRRVPRSNADALVPVTEGFRLSGGEIGAAQTFAQSTRMGRSEIRFEVAPELLDAVQRIGETWRLLLELSGAAENPAVLHVEALTSRLEKERADSEAAIRDEYEAQLAALEDDQGDRFRTRLIERLRRLTGLSGGANGLRVSAGSGPAAEEGEEAPT